MYPKLITLTVLLALASSSAASGQTRPAAPRSELAIRTSASRHTVTRAGTIAFSITVTNQTVNTLTEVTVCDELPSSVTRVLKDGGLHLFAGTACRTFASLSGTASIFIRLQVQIGAHARLGIARNRALAIWSSTLISTSSRYRIGPTRGICQTG